MLNGVDLAQPAQNAAAATKKRWENWNKLRGYVQKSIERGAHNQSTIDAGQTLVGQPIAQMVQLLTANDAHILSREERP